MGPPADLHPWDVTPKEAAEIQTQLRVRLNLTWDGRRVTTVGGVDVSIKANRARAAFVVLSYPDLAVLDVSIGEMEASFPYVPGLLTFREGPAVLAAWEGLEAAPDLLLFDGQGIAHPRGIGLAAHMGLWLRTPSIGVAKSRLYGVHSVPLSAKGELAHLYDEVEQERVIGAVLRTRSDVRPVYVTPGHLMDVRHAVHFVLNCCTRYRLPEPTRWAHRAAGGESLPERS